MFFNLLFYFSILERGSEGETSVPERNINRLPFECAPTRGLNPQPRYVQESNQQPFSLLDDAQLSHTSRGCANI